MTSHFTGCQFPARNNKINQVLSNSVLRMGRFHQMMSFIGFIGYIMLGSGLQVLFKLIYPEQSINVMLHGKKIFRETQAQTLIYTVLCGYLTSKLFECNLEEPYNNGIFTINSSLQTLKEKHEDTTSCTMQALIITILLHKLLLFSNDTMSKTVTIWM